MRSHYKRIGDYVTPIKLKNTDGSISLLKGININKHFMPSVANINGTDLSKYRVVKKNQFAFNPMHVGRDEVLPISMLEEDEPIIVSPAYVVFEVKDEDELLPAYLMMWCRRSEFDRNAWFMTDNSVRGGFSWTDFCDMEFPVPSIEKQREIVREYNVVNDRIALSEKLIQQLEDTAQAIYKQWFVDFEFPISKECAVSIGKPELEGKPYKSSGGEMAYSNSLGIEFPTSWSVKNIANICEVINGRAYKNGEYRESGTKIVRIQNLNGGNKWLYSDMKLPANKYVSNGDLIFAWSATFGPFIWRQEKSIYHYHIWRMDCFNLDAKFFLYHHLNRVTNEVSEQGSGSIFAHITKGVMESQELVYPDDNVLALFSRIVKKIDKKVETTLLIKSSCLLLREIIKGRMSKA